VLWFLLAGFDSQGAGAIKVVSIPSGTIRDGFSTGNAE